MSCGRIEVVRCSAPLVVSKSIVSNAPSSVSEPDVVSAESSPTAASVTVRSDVYKRQAFVILYSPVKLPQAISRCEA